MSTSERLAVPVIEDNNEHFTMMEAALRDGYKLTLFSAMDEGKLYNYKALNPESQIVIVDLRLDAKAEGNEDEGYRTIEKVLWPADRTTFFVIFSEYVGLGNSKIPDSFSVSPHWVFVPKVLENGRLTDECLANLRTVMDQFARYSSPLLTTPFYDSFPFIQEINEYCAAVGLGKTMPEQLDLLRRGLSRSTNRLNEMARTSAAYAKAGLDTRHIGLAVYGSCGRLEMREDSDVEFSVYWDRDAGPEVGSLAVQLWNRMAAHFRRRQWAFEGEKKLEKYPNMLLPPERADQPLENRFFPVIVKQALPEVWEAATLRTRAYQILTELRPSFNPEFFDRLAREVIAGQTSKSPLVADVVTSNFFRDMAVQLIMDTGPDKTLDWKGVKRFCFRIMNTWALRLALIQFGGKYSLTEDSERSEFLEVLRAPPLVKLVRFGKYLLENGRHDSLAFGEFFALYAGILADFHKLSHEVAQRRGSVGKGFADQMRSKLVTLGDSFYRLLNSGRLRRPGDPDSWLFGTEGIKEVLRDLGAR